MRKSFFEHTQNRRILRSSMEEFKKKRKKEGKNQILFSKFI